MITFVPYRNAMRLRHEVLMGIKIGQSCPPPAETGSIPLLMTMLSRFEVTVVHNIPNWTKLRLIV